MTHPENLIRGIRDMSDALLAAYPMLEAVHAYQANPTLRAAGGEPGRGTDVPDPVFAIVASLTVHDEWCIGLKEAHDAVRNLQRLAYAAVREHPLIAQQADANRKNWRCNGQWDVTCTRFADKLTGKYAGVCATCIRAIQRDEQDKRERESA